jgi:ankyrin repeat protein
MERPLSKEEKATVQLHKAIKLGDAEGAQRARSSNADVNAVIPDLSFPPLHLACHNGDLTLVNMLLAAGAQGDRAVLKYRFTPLYMAAARGHHTIVIRLLAQGVHQHNDELKRAFNKAVDHGHANAVEVFIENGMTVDTVDQNNKTPLRRAVESGHLELLKMLCDRGGDINQLYSDGESPLHCAVKRYLSFHNKRNSAEIIIELLTRGANPDQLDGEKRCLFDYVLQARYIDITVLQILISAGSSIQESHEHILRKKLSHLEEIVLFGGPGELNAIMSSGSSDKFKSDVLERALSLAAGQARMEMAKAMLLNQVDPQKALLAVALCLTRCRLLKQQQLEMIYQAIEALLISHKPRTPSPLPTLGPSPIMIHGVVQPNH